MTCEPMSGWFVIGFTPDDVVIAGQDSRLALACQQAAQKEETVFEILQTPGDEKHLIVWYIADATAEILTRHSIAWRQFLIGEIDTPPANAFCVLGEKTE